MRVIDFKYEWTRILGSRKGKTNTTLSTTALSKTTLSTTTITKPYPILVRTEVASQTTRFT